MRAADTEPDEYRASNAARSTEHHVLSTIHLPEYTCEALTDYALLE